MQPLSAKQKTLRLAATVAAAALLSLNSHAYAAPQGGTTTEGTATLSTGANTTIVTQTTDRATIDWQSFNLAADETVQFIVPSNTSATLNRIHDSRPSTISGSITSNGVVYFSNPNGLIFDASSSVIANGITATAGTITVNGSLQATSGNILISSTTLTTIGSNANISVDALATGNGGRAIIWSDKRTDFHGYISARGGTTSGDGGFVEVSGKITLNYNGQVNTLAPHGKTGTLLLDPTDITISTGNNSDAVSNGTFSANSLTSIVNTTTLQTALGTSNVIIDATAGTGTGSGLITVESAITAAATNSHSLTLKGGQIIINADINLSNTTGANLILNATRASVWQDPTTVITAATISGEAYDGFTLNGANKFSYIGTITNHGGAGISVKNAQNLAITSGITLAGGTGGVSILAPEYDVELKGALTVTGKFLRLDMGSKNLKGAFTITASGLDVFFTSATASGNAATIAVGGGTFTFVNDRRDITSAFSIDNNTGSSLWGTGLGTITSGTATASGLTVTGTGNINGLGFVIGSWLSINGVTTGPAKDMRYIEAPGIQVTTASTFSGSLMLVGSGITGRINTQNEIQRGISILQDLTAGAANDGTSNLTLLQNGVVTENGLYFFSSTIRAGAALSLIQTGKTGSHAIAGQGSRLTAGGAMTLSQSGKASFSGIGFTSSTITARDHLTVTMSGMTGSYALNLFQNSTLNSDRGDMIVTASGFASSSMMSIDASTLTAPLGNLSVTASGTSLTDSGMDIKKSTLSAGRDIGLLYSGYTRSGNGILVLSSDLLAGGNLNLESRGTIGSGFFALMLQSETAGGSGLGRVRPVVFEAGTNGFVYFKTNNQTMALVGYDNFTVNRGRVRIDLGTGEMVSRTNTFQPIDAANAHTLTALGRDVIFSGASTGNAAKINVGSGYFYVAAVKTGDYTFDPADLPAFAPAGLTISSTNTRLGGLGEPIVVTGAAIVTDGQMTLLSADYSYNASTRPVVVPVALLGGTFQTVGSSSFTKTLLLASTSGGFNVGGAVSGISEGNLTILSRGKIRLNAIIAASGGVNLISAGNMILEGTSTVSGGPVTVDLGKGDLEVGSGSGSVVNGIPVYYSITTNSQNLTLTAGRIVNGSANPIFKLGTGRLSFGEASGVGESKLDSLNPVFTLTTESITNGYKVDDLLTLYNIGGALLSGNNDYTINIAGYYFKDGQAVTKTGDGIPTLKLPTTALANYSRQIGTRKEVDAAGRNQGLVAVGSANSGEWGWRAAVDSTFKNEINIVLPVQKPIEFAGVNTAVTNVSLLQPTTIKLSGTNVFSHGFNLTATGTITQDGGTLTVSGGDLYMTASGGISLNQTGNNLGTLNDITNTGSGNILIKNSGGALALNGNITGAAGTTITIDTRGATTNHLTLSKGIASQGGDVILIIGGNYNPNNNAWNLFTKGLDLTANGWAGPNSSFPAFTGVSGTFRTNLTRSQGGNPYAKGSDARYYFTQLGANTQAFKEAAAELAEIDPNAMLLNFSAMNEKQSKGAGFEQDGGTVNWTPAEADVSIDIPTKIGVFKLSASSDPFATYTPNFQVGTELAFAGRNRVGYLELTTYNDRIKQIIFVDGASVTGTISPPVSNNLFAEIVVGSDVALPSIDNSYPTKFWVTDSLRQAAGSRFNFNNGISIASLNGNAVNVWLTNSGNSINRISGSTNGGSISLVTNSASGFTLVDLKTGGGSVVVTNNSGGINGTQNLVTGGFHFRATGEVELSGVMASTSGTGSSVSINNTSAGWVVGNVTSDTAVTLQGR
ncbi:MAG: filamentous hemagglutinin N-terminal domain-containing protein, partial [Candidatus Pacebacteria bacterium]|nr:filamentous hemagglutinin N-terminal domain-containing protein [Candidatus Paceibacterota bacterium]